jgi:hypothetical protein
MVGLSGLEPLASSLSGTRSNQLSYKPMRVQGPHQDITATGSRPTPEGRTPLGNGIDGPACRQADLFEHVPNYRKARIDFWPARHRESCIRDWHTASLQAHELPPIGLRNNSLERR